MSQAYEPVKWVNGLGQVTWQPQTLSGEKMYWSDYYNERVWETRNPSGKMGVVLYRSKAKANRVARRKDKRDARGEWREA